MDPNRNRKPRPAFAPKIPMKKSAAGPASNNSSAPSSARPSFTSQGGGPGPGGPGSGSGLLGSAEMSSSTADFDQMFGSLTAEKAAEQRRLRLEAQNVKEYHWYKLEEILAMRFSILLARWSLLRQQMRQH